MEARELEYRRISEAEGESAARARIPRPTAREFADELQELAVVCNRNLNTLLDAVAAWAESRDGQSTGDERSDAEGLAVVRR